PRAGACRLSPVRSRAAHQVLSSKRRAELASETEALALAPKESLGVPAGCPLLASPGRDRRSRSWPARARGGSTRGGSIRCHPGALWTERAEGARHAQAARGARSACHRVPRLRPFGLAAPARRSSLPSAV